MKRHSCYLVSRSLHTKTKQTGKMHDTYTPAQALGQKTFFLNSSLLKVLKGKSKFISAKPFISLLL
jgi:hypothetical protein